MMEKWKYKDMIELCLLGIGFMLLLIHKAIVLGVLVSP